MVGAPAGLKAMQQADAVFCGPAMIQINEPTARK
jgi:hypothetical protein